ncbi:MAG: hypothetical protein V7608_6622 [Hyphomicrobiales bacterium]|jgi:hypothetical protein
MRAGLWSLLAGLCVAFALEPACAQTGPVIVVPGKPGFPVIMNGVIVDGAVVYGDWGLAKPNNAGLIIEGGVYAVPPIASWAPGYFPATGRQPRVGRQEVEPPAQARRPVNTDYHRDWSIGSEFNKPVTEYPPFDPPPVIVAPREPRNRDSNRNTNRDAKRNIRRDVR